MNKNNPNIENNLYKISKIVHDAHDLNKLFKNLHDIIFDLVGVKNFYIALLNKDLDLLTYPYYHDIKDHPPKEKFSEGKGLTHYTIKKGEGMIFNKEDYQSLADQNLIELIGSPPYCWMGVPLKDYNNSIIGLIAIQSYREDIIFDENDLRMMSFVSEQLTLGIERFQHIQELKHMTYYDPIMELPNKSSLFKEGIKIIDGDLTACAFVDLDDFMLINDTHGNEIANNLLQNISYKLSKLVDKNTKVFYWGADKFTITLSNCKNIDEIKNQIKKIKDVICKPIKINGESFSMTSSIGVSISPLHGNNINDLCRDADIAMHQAKEKGKNKIQIFKEYMKDVIISNYGIEQSLKHAVNEEQWEIYYQPQIHSETNDVIGFEALIRWKHPEKGLIMPSKFIPTAEMNNHIFEIGEYVMKKVCRQTQIWNKNRKNKMIASINISAKEFQRKHLIDLLDQTLEDSGISTDELNIEITENTFLDKNIDQIKKIKDRGIKISIDDFGTGYSSLSYLYEYPIDTIKIDKSFVRDIEKDNQKKILSNSIINLAHNLDLKIVTEGVETKEELNFFRSKDCSIFQGYFFSKPLSKEEFEKFIGF
tara:strand:- start:354 stop:2132 length:1779 start_codon:yes stop_codon:yes gene_type:complete